MDDSWKSLLQPDETVLDYLSRDLAQRVETGIQILDCGSSLHMTDVIEICGRGGAGKTEILYSVASSYILPHSIDGVEFGGKDRHIIFFDLDYKFDIVRMSEVLQQRVGNCILKSKSPLQADDDLQQRVASLVKTALEKMHIFSCTSTFEFVATLKVLPASVIPKMYSLGGTLGAVIIDNIAAPWDIQRFFRSQKWQSKAKACVSSYPMGSIIKSLTEIQRLCHVPLILSRRISYSDSSEQDVTKLDRTDWRDFTTKVMHIQRTQENSTYEETKWSHKAIWIKPAVSHATYFKIQAMGPRMTNMHA